MGGLKGNQARLISHFSKGLMKLRVNLDLTVQVRFDEIASKAYLTIHVESDEIASEAYLTFK